MPKISFRIVPASRESISHVQTGAARKPDRSAIRAAFDAPPYAEVVSETIIAVSDVIDPKIEQILSDGLDEYNTAAAGRQDRLPLCVSVTDRETGRIVGAATGRTSLGLLFLDMFYLEPGQRSAGLGTRVLEAFEAEGRRRGCRSAVLYTINFQAPEFYAKRGWTAFGEVPSAPGTSRIFMSKTL
jgi:GNAT superfamily N-acetyltransferase